MRSHTELMILLAFIVDDGISFRRHHGTRVGILRISQYIIFFNVTKELPPQISRSSKKTKKN